MIAEERRQKLSELVTGRGFMSLAELSASLGASLSTVRRDVDALHEAGVVRRSHGGAAAVSAMGERSPLPAFEERRLRNAAEKQRIGAAMAALILDGETVILDGGTTTFEVARHLAGRPVQVITNSLPIAHLLSGGKETELLMVGGYVYPKTGVALGAVAVAQLAGMAAQRLVMGVAGLTERGLYNGNVLLVETERAMMAAAAETNVVADSSKFGQRGLAHLADWPAVGRVVTDAGVTAEGRAMVAAGTELLVAEGGEP